MHSSAACRTLACALPGTLVAQGDLVRLGDVVGLDGPESCAQALASLPQQLEGVGGGALRGGTLRISPVFLDEVGLQGCGDFVGRLQRVVDGPIPCSVVNHRVSIAPPRVSGSPGTHPPDGIMTSCHAAMTALAVCCVPARPWFLYEALDDPDIYPFPLRDA